MLDAQPVLDLIDAFRSSKAMFTAVSLGIFDRLENSPAAAPTLAAELHVDPSALKRLLDACVALNLLARSGEIFHNRPIATRYLRVDSPETLTGYILYSNRVLYRLWEDLEGALREGTPRWKSVFGGQAGVFEELFSSDDSRSSFIAGMHGFGLLASPVIVSVVDLSRFTHVCDVGGASGHLAIEACRRYPHLRATVFDLPGVLPHAERYIAAAELSGRVTTHAGDFFVDPLPPADLYALSRIVHDWSEPKVDAILRKIHGHLPDDGGLLLCEKILYPLEDGPLGASLQSLNMLVCMEGQERTAAQYEALVRRAGFRQFHTWTTGRPLDAMLAIK